MKLSKKESAELQKAFKKFPEIKSVILFGSRAKGNSKKGSDIDLALKGKNLDDSTVSKVHDLLEEETSLPYFFDVINYATITGRELKEHIDRCGKIIYETH